jgi:hypothetical protein
VERLLAAGTLKNYSNPDYREVLWWNRRGRKVRPKDVDTSRLGRPVSSLEQLVPSAVRLQFQPLINIQSSSSRIAIHR